MGYAHFHDESLLLRACGGLLRYTTLVPPAEDYLDNLALSRSTTCPPWALCRSHLLLAISLSSQI